MEQAKLRSGSPLVSVVTPFYNTSQYLAQCIESVLAQSYTCFEYILVDNCSSDGSSEIAETYARRDPRIRLYRRPRILPQLQNYNDALSKISQVGEYCKIVQADDYILPQCLELMIQAFEQSESIGLVSSYRLIGDLIQGAGYPYPSPMLSGKECAQLYLREGVYVFGTETTVMYRSSVVRHYRPFYDESLPNNADFDRCMQLLQHWDFGFVHQILSFSRRDNQSITSAILSFKPYDLDRYFVVQRYAPIFLETREATLLRRRAKRIYYRSLAKEALRCRERAFWRFHKAGLKTIDETIDWPYLVMQIGVMLFWSGLNPGSTVYTAVDFWKKRISCRKARSKVNRTVEPLVHQNSEPPGSGHQAH
jgi:glycosyltransferase involved in cell wall biosynthesis